MIRLVSLFLFALPSLLLANGGGYTQGLKFTGHPAPFELQGVEQVEILDEQLSIVLEPLEARVRVEYRMKNTGPKTKVTFGFPIEAGPISELDGRQLSLSQRVEENFKSYRVTAGGVPVKAKYEPEPLGKKGRLEFPGAEALREVGGWMVSTVSFAAREEKAVTISYQVRHLIDHRFVSDDNNQSAAEFVYRLSTGAVWKGPIQRGLIHVSTRYINPDKVKIKSPAGKFRRVGDEWTWEFANLEPSLKDDLLIEAVPGRGDYVVERASGKPAAYSHEGGKYYRHHENYSVKASSELPPSDGKQYRASNVRKGEADDSIRASAWTEGAEGQGIGEWLELTLNKPERVSAIEIITGYADTDALFAANSRPSELEVTLNGKHRFTAPLQDIKEKQSIPIRGYTQPVSKIRLTIKQVYPGSRYEDTCVTYVRLVSPLAKKPKVELAR